VSAEFTVSIVITCYNYAPYVGLAIESALAQTDSNVEIVVVDDGSTDGSDQVIARYQGRLTSVRQENQGHLVAFYRGYRESTGAVIIFLDADDLLEPTAVALVRNAWHPACAKAQYDLAIIDQVGQPLGRLCNFGPNYDSQRVMSEFGRFGTYRWPVTSGNAYARTFLDQILPLDVELGPDGYLNTIAPLYGDVITIAKPLGSFRLHGRNLWSSLGSDLDRLPIRINHRYREIDFLRDHAARRGVALPPGNILDHEFTFVTYRLMATKMAMSYRHHERDTPFRLWSSGLSILFRDAQSAKSTIVHSVWLTVLALTPGALARPLCILRFRLSALRRPRRQTA